MMENIHTYLLDVKGWGTDLIVIGLTIMLLFNLKGISDALKGGNGRWQMEEIAKATILGLIIYMVYVEANREHEWHIFSDMAFMTFIIGLFFLAKLEGVVDKITNIYKKNNGSKKDSEDSKR